MAVTAVAPSRRLVAYLFNTPDDIQSMLETIGADSIETFFEQVPHHLQLDQPLDLPPGLSEPELEAHLRQLAAANHGTSSRVCLMGAGVYDHFIPAAVDEIASRGEFYTAYTPYQAEASQGSLQAFFEFQTLICQLTGMDVSNASLYEGGTAVSEAVFMAMRVTGRHDRVVVLGSLHPEYQQVLETYLGSLGCQLDVIATPDGVADVDIVSQALDSETSCLVIQQPNVFGAIENLESLCQAAHEVGALAITSFDPISLGLLKSPAACGADIAVAEGQSLGIPAQYGGPYLGILTCRQKHVRQMPGRLIGQTVDRNGRRCFVLNLQAREQHIRREKATSNICTNQGLLAVRATIYLALLGRQGLLDVAQLCCQKAHYAADRLGELPGLELMFQQPFFKEFTLKCQGDATEWIDRAAAAGFDLGPDLARFPRLRESLGDDADQTLLVAVTEQRTREEIDRLVRSFASVSAHSDTPQSLGKPA
ncbi:MAG: aminomethyl-transferring glycine dehydrogenase subunit GcvPA [Planctomycetaceae bacterium]